MILCRSVYYDRPGNFTRKGSTTQSGKFQALEGTSTGTVPIPTLPEWRECGGWQDLLKSGELRHDPLHARPEVRIDFPSTVAQLRHVAAGERSEEHTSELQSRGHIVCRLLLEKNNNQQQVR